MTTTDDLPRRIEREIYDKPLRGILTSIVARLDALERRGDLAAAVTEQLDRAERMAGDHPLVGTPSPDAPPLTAEQIAAVEVGDEVWRASIGDPAGSWHRVILVEHPDYRGSLPLAIETFGWVPRTGIRTHRPARPAEPARPEPGADVVRAFRELIAKAECIRHWHDTGRDGEGMVVSAAHVRELWEELPKSRAALSALDASPELFAESAKTSPPADAAAIRDAALEEAKQIALADRRSEVARSCGHKPHFVAVQQDIADDIEALRSTPAPAQAEVTEEDVRAAIRTAYGHLWRVSHPSTDVIMARKALLAVMTPEEQRAAIHDLYARGYAPRQPEGYA